MGRRRYQNDAREAMRRSIGWRRSPAAAGMPGGCLRRGLRTILDRGYRYCTVLLKICNE